MGSKQGSNCKCGTQANSQTAPPIVITAAQLNPISQIFKLPTSFRFNPKGVEKLILDNTTTNNLNKAIPNPLKNAFMPQLVRSADDFCSKTPEFWKETGPKWFLYNDIVEQAWKATCRCKFPCPVPGGCGFTLYEVSFSITLGYLDGNGQKKSDPRSGSMYVYGPINGMEETGFGDGTRFHVNCHLADGTPEVHYCGINSNSAYYFDRQYGITSIRRIDGLPDECVPVEPPDAPPPPLPINPPGALYGQDPPVPPPPPPPEPVLYFPIPVFREPPQLFIPTPREKPCPPCNCKCPPPPPPTYIEVPVEMPGIPGLPGVPGIPGLPGFAGAKGDQGEKGADGEDGSQGAKGDQGEKGADGEDGDQGEKGADGEDGDQGEKGADGEDAEVEFTEVEIQLFDRCDPDTDAPLYVYESVMAIVGTENQVTASFRRLALIEALQCQREEAIAAVPEWWQVRIEGHRPQLVMLFGEVQPDGRIAAGHYALTIPHYVGGQSNIPPIGRYQKGQIEGILTLNDNSKVIVNAATQTEAERVLFLAKQVINPVRLEGSFMKVGTRKGQILLTGELVARYGKYFATGLQNTKPNWTIQYR